MSRLTIEYVKQICEAKNVEFLDEYYINNRTKLNLKCKEGHVFKTTLNDLRKSNGCQTCYNKIRNLSQKHTLEYVKQICEEKGFTLLSTEYIKNSKKLILKCKENHDCAISFLSIQAGKGCVICANEKKSKNLRFSLEKVISFCKEKGFEYISGSYINSFSKLNLTCKNGHSFISCYSNIHNNRGCPICGNKNKGKNKLITINHIENICKIKNIKCLEAISPIHPDTILKFKCQNDHEFAISYKNARVKKHICPICIENKQKEINLQFEQTCKEKQFQCLDNYHNIKMKDKLKFKCKYDHIFTSSKLNINRGYGCSLCIPQPLTIEVFKEIAINKNGQCLSTEYKHGVKLKFYCNFCQKSFWADPNCIKNSNSWCPNCCETKSEKICRIFMQTIFNCEFDKQKPKWLINPKTNRYLELDGYNEDLSLAFEHNGRMHYEKIEEYHMTNEDLEYNKYKDQIKLDICKQNNVKLIVIPELGKKVKLENLKSYIKEQCLLQNIALPNNFDDIQIDSNQIYF